MFITPLPAVRLLSTGEHYELTEPLRWHTADGRVEQVDAGYVTDFASVPRPARTLAPNSGRHTPAAIRHDARCDDLRYGVDPLDAREVLTSRQADREFYEGIRQLDPGRPLRALVMWAGVRLGAVASPWRRDRQTWADLPKALAVVLAVAPLYLPVIVVNGVASLLDEAAQRVTCRLVRPRPTPAPVITLPTAQTPAERVAA